MSIDMDARYRVSHWPKIAVWVAGWVKENVYEGDYLVCEDEECDHGASEMCWVEGDWSIVESDSMVEVVMVGDDIVHHVDVDDLVKIEDDEYCSGCGQIGCGWGAHA
jgi:hypothetical protein